MKATPRGVVVLLPADLDAQSPGVQAFVEDGLAKLGPTPPVPSEDSLTPGDLRDAVDEWAAHIKVHVNRVQIRAMCRKWASCSSKGNLTLSADLVRLPRRLVDYVICHELVHLRIPEHGKGFQASMNGYMPDWRERERELAAYALQFLD